MRKSNNPKGRNTVEDKRILVGIYVPTSLIEKYGTGKYKIIDGKKHLRSLLQEFTKSL